MRQLTEKEASGRIYRAEHDTNAVVLFVPAKHDDSSKPRRILDARDRNDMVDANHTPLSSITELWRKSLLEKIGARLT